MGTNILWRQNNPELRKLQRKRWKIRNKLRLLGYLPDYGNELNDDQKRIWEQLNHNDFSIWDEIKTRIGHDGGDPDKWTKPKIVPNEKRLWFRAKQNAKESNYEFNLDVEDIVIPKFCPYLQIRLETDYKYRYSDNYYSIDRIDSSKGYVKGNVQVISRLANTMKSNATIEQLKIFSESVLRYHIK